MASLLSRRLFKVSGKINFFPVIRTYRKLPYVDPLRGRHPSKDVEMADNLGHCVGLERYEMLAHLAGNDDPFETKLQKKASGTKEDPTMVTSIYTSRLIGCVCEEDTDHIRWMQLYRGEPKRCFCGYWWELSIPEDPDYGHKFLDGPYKYDPNMV